MAGITLVCEEMPILSGSPRGQKTEAFYSSITWTRGHFSVIRLVCNRCWNISRVTLRGLRRKTIPNRSARPQGATTCNSSLARRRTATLSSHIRPGAHGFLAGKKRRHRKTEDLLIPQMHSGLIRFSRNIRQECSKLLLNCPISFGAEVARIEKDHIHVGERRRFPETRVNDPKL